MEFTKRAIDLNADLGEHDGDGFPGDDAILGVVSSASVACGAHAGSKDVMLRTVELAAARGVTVGAHPGYPDRQGFGRRELDLTLDAIGYSVSQQIELLAECCKLAGTKLAYVKPHGALYNRAVNDAYLARTIAGCIANFDRSLVVLTLPRSALRDEAQELGLEVAAEAFIDRAYMPDGTLVPRSRADAIIHDVIAASERAVELARTGHISAVSGERLAIVAESLCVHGDNPDALATVTAARRALEDAGVSIEPFAR
jgi:UPF0271 protein